MNIAIIEDKYVDYKTLEDNLIKYFTSTCMNLIPQFHYFQDDTAFLIKFKSNIYDFIFIDFYLNTLTGLEIAKRIREKDCSVKLIFTTSSRDYAIESYKVKASGYLVKPITFHDLYEIMELIDYKQIYNKRFIEIMCKGDNRKILLNEIIYCDIDGHYTQIHMINSKIEKYRITFTNFEKLLSPYPEFLICFKGCIVNMKYIKKVADLSFIMCNEEYIPFRKKYKSEILKCYSDFLVKAVREDWL